MYVRTAVVAPLMLAAVLNAQETPEIQGPTPAQQLEQLKLEKQRLQKEIGYAKERVDNASSLLSKKLQRSAPEFKSIDAGKPKGMLSVQPRKRVERKVARIGTAEEMKIGGGEALVVVNRRGISQAAYDDVSNYLKSYNPQANEDLTAQRVLYDLIRIEGVAGEFVENPGKVQLAEAYDKLRKGEMSFEDAAQKYGTVQGAGKDGQMNVTRNSVQGPFFEFLAFSTEVGKVSRPFLSPRGYVVLKPEQLIKGQQPSLDKVACKVVLFKFAEDDKVMLDAQYKVTSGQADVLVRDESILKKLPALYRPQEARPSPLKMMADQVRNLQGALDQLEAKGEGDTQQAQAIRGQIQALQKRIDEIAAEKADETDDKQDADQKPDVIKGAPKIKAAPQPKKPGGGN
jgi:hypothetical protein